MNNTGPSILITVSVWLYYVYNIPSWIVILMVIFGLLSWLTSDGEIKLNSRELLRLQIEDKRLDIRRKIKELRE